MPHPFFTIGHSTRTLEEFSELLLASAVELVADVRTVPRSRTNPQFNRDTLPEELARRQIGYVHMRALGGLRGRVREIGESPNIAWRNSSFRNYADYAMTEPFRSGLADLIKAGRETRTAIMCAEAVWWRCHRRIIADYLLSRGETVLHVLGRGQISPATLSPSARLRPDGILVYDRT